MVTKLNTPNIIIEPPGPNAKKIIELDNKYLVKSTKVSPIVVKEARGSTVTDVDGNTYIDLTAGIAVMNVGHCHPEIIKTIREQAEKFIHFAGQDYYYEIQAKTAEMLSEIVPGKFPKQAFLSNSGTEANECALKLVRWHTRKPGMLSFFGAFHGRTMGSLSMNAAKSLHTKHLHPLIPGAIKTPYAYCYRCFAKLEYPGCGLWCAKYIEEILFEEVISPQDVAAMLIEPIQGEHGYVIPPDSFLGELKKICERNEILFIADEVQTGFGRTGKLFAVEHSNVEPDLMSLAKAIASGVPMGATVVRKDIADWDSGSHSNTTGGSPLACAVALKNMEIIKKERLVENSLKVGNRVLKRLKEFENKSKSIGDVRGKGLMIGVEFVEDKKTKKPAISKIKDIVMIGLQKGLILLPSGFSTIRIAPPLVITNDEADNAMDIFEETILSVERK